jgi:hypothetical protein
MKSRELLFTALLKRNSVTILGLEQVDVRREKALVFSGCKSRPRTGSRESTSHPQSRYETVLCMALVDRFS